MSYRQLMKIMNDFINKNIDNIDNVEIKCYDKVVISISSSNNVEIIEMKVTERKTIGEWIIEDSKLLVTKYDKEFNKVVLLEKEVEDKFYAEKDISRVVYDLNHYLLSRAIKNARKILRKIDDSDIDFRKDSSRDCEYKVYYVMNNKARVVVKTVHKLRYKSNLTIRYLDDDFSSKRIVFNVSKSSLLKTLFI